LAKKQLTKKEKIYLTDLGIAYLLNTAKLPNIGSAYENIVYNELVSRGYKVCIGKVKNFEVDFIATKGDIVEYYQVSYALSDESIIEREFRSLGLVSDNYPKYLITGDKHDFSKNGIIHKNIIDWLLEVK
jgi:predicted AAA+ superfamily ATPase